jgi:hypothetical protein
VSFNVSSDSTRLQDVSIPTVAIGCTPSNSFYDQLYIPSIAIAADGSFTSTTTQTGALFGVPAAFTYTFSGHFHGTNSSGAERVAGAFREDITYNNGTAFSCTSNNQSWSTASVPSVPVVTSISPSSGPPAGGTVVTITGSGFTGATRVGFGGLAAASFTVVSGTQITAVSPAQSGAHYVTVTTPGGTSATVAAAIYSYSAPAPAITSISPTSGPTTGGTTVTITGSGFTGATRVGFGGLAAASFTVVSGTQITAVSPAQSGAHYVTVTTPGGTSATVAAAIYSYSG